MKFVLFLMIFLGASAAFAFQSIVILPFANQSKDQHLYWLGEGFAESLSEEMFLQNAYLIARPERKKAYDDLHLPYIGDLSRATMLKIGEKLSADYLIFGSYDVLESTMQVNARVIRLSSSELSQPIQASGSLDDLFRIQMDVKNGLIKYFEGEKMPATSDKAFQGKPVPLPAYEWYIKGLLEATDNDRVRFYQKAIEANPGYQQAVYRLGLTLARLQRYKESTDTLKKAAFSGMFQEKVTFVMALNLFLSHEFDGAYQTWLELSKTQQTPEVDNNIGIALLKKGDSAGSGWYLSKAIELDPHNPDYHFNLAASYVLRSFDKQAQAQYREAIRYKPSDFQSIYLMGKLLDREGKETSNRVMQCFQDALPADQKGKFPEQYTSVVQILRPAPLLLTPEESQYLSVARQKELDARATYVKSYQGNARKYLEEDSADKALPEIRKGLGLDPLDWYLHYLWGWAIWQKKDRDSAMQELNFSIWCRDNVESHLLLAEIFRHSEKFADAKVQVQKTLALEPGNKKALEIWNKIWDKD